MALVRPDPNPEPTGPLEWRILVGILVVLAGGCSVEQPLPPPPPSPSFGSTVIGVAYGQITRTGEPLAAAKYRTWAHTNECATPTGGEPVNTADSLGRYRKELEFLGRPATVCLTFRLYYDDDGEADSLDVAGTKLMMKARSGPSTVPDSVRVDMDIP
ncbi:MAG: hypothetical protein R2909_12220 [Gemmatimonadales bacterium]